MCFLSQVVLQAQSDSNLCLKAVRTTVRTARASSNLRRHESRPTPAETAPNERGREETPASPESVPLCRSHARAAVAVRQYLVVHGRGGRGGARRLRNVRNKRLRRQNHRGN